MLCGYDNEFLLGMIKYWSCLMLVDSLSLFIVWWKEGSLYVGKSCAREQQLSRAVFTLLTCCSKSHIGGGHRSRNSYQFEVTRSARGFRGDVTYWKISVILTTLLCHVIWTNSAHITPFEQDLLE